MRIRAASAVVFVFFSVLLACQEKKTGEGPTPSAVPPPSSTVAASPSVVVSAPPEPPSTPPPPSSSTPAKKPVAGQPCLNRDEANDAKCVGRAKPHHFVWDAHACAVAKETVSEVSKRCDAIGPHRAMNVESWCCP